MKALLPVLLLLFVVIVPSIADEMDDDEREVKTEELKELKTKINALRQDLNSVRNLHDKVRVELRETEVSISKRFNNLKKIKQKLNKQTRRLKKLHRRHNQLQHNVSQQRDLLGRQIRTAYTIGKQEYIKLLLNQENPGAVGRVLTYYEYFNHARSQRIYSAKQSLINLTRVKQTIKQETKTLKRLQQQQLAEKEKLEHSYQKRAIVIVKLNLEIQGKDQVLQQLLEDQKQLERVLDIISDNMPEMVTESNIRQPFAKLKGKLFWPVLGRVKKLFGKKRDIVNIKWNGVFIQARQGNNVRAISHGRIAYADWLRGYGLLIIIDHGDGYMSLYGHNQVISRETGDWVDAGDIIGKVGNSGGQQHSGLYFEIRQNGRPTNPGIWCRKTFTG